MLSALSRRTSSCRNGSYAIVRGMIALALSLFCSTAAIAQPVPISEPPGYLDVRRWVKIQPGQSAAQVERFLGTPTARVGRDNEVLWIYETWFPSQLFSPTKGLSQAGKLLVTLDRDGNRVERSQIKGDPRRRFLRLSRLDPPSEAALQTIMSRVLVEGWFQKNKAAEGAWLDPATEVRQAWRDLKAWSTDTGHEIPRWLDPGAWAVATMSAATGWPALLGACLSEADSSGLIVKPEGEPQQGKAQSILTYSLPDGRVVARLTVQQDSDDDSDSRLVNATLRSIELPNFSLVFQALRGETEPGSLISEARQVGTPSDLAAVAKDPPIAPGSGEPIAEAGTRPSTEPSQPAAPPNRFRYFPNVTDSRALEVDLGDSGSALFFIDKEREASVGALQAVEFRQPSSLGDARGLLYLDHRGWPARLDTTDGVSIGFDWHVGTQNLTLTTVLPTGDVFTNTVVLMGDIPDYAGPNLGGSGLHKSLAPGFGSRAGPDHLRVMTSVRSECASLRERESRYVVTRVYDAENGQEVHAVSATSHGSGVYMAKIPTRRVVTEDSAVCQTIASTVLAFCSAMNQLPPGWGPQLGIGGALAGSSLAGYALAVLGISSAAVPPTALLSALVFLGVASEASCLGTRPFATASGSAGGLLDQIGLMEEICQSQRIETLLPERVTVGSCIVGGPCGGWQRGQVLDLSQDPSPTVSIVLKLPAIENDKRPITGIVVKKYRHYGDPEYGKAPDPSNPYSPRQGEHFVLSLETKCITKRGLAFVEVGSAQRHYGHFFFFPGPGRGNEQHIISTDDGEIGEIVTIKLHYWADFESIEFKRRRKAGRTGKEFADQRLAKQLVLRQ